MKKDQELIVITKTYDLILWSCNPTSKFPRNHRFVLGERIGGSAGSDRLRSWLLNRSDPGALAFRTEGLLQAEVLDRSLFLA